MGDNDIATLLEPKQTYHLYAGEKQPLFFKITIPSEGYKSSYSVQYQFNELKARDPNAMIGSAMSPKSAINIKIVNNTPTIKPQGYTEGQITTNPIPISPNVAIITEQTNKTQIDNSKKELESKTSDPVGSLMGNNEGKVKDSGDDLIRIGGVLVVGIILVFGAWKLNLLRFLKKTPEPSAQQTTSSIPSPKNDKPPTTRQRLI
jgi:hypothetical protein